MVESDRILIQQIRRGAAGAWEQFIDRYQGRLIGYVSRRIADRATVEDIVQDTLLGFLSRLDDFDETRPIEAFLFRIASNKLIDHLRRQGREPIQKMPKPHEMPEAQFDSQPGVSSIARGKERVELEELALVSALAEVIRDAQEREDYVRIMVLELLWVKGWRNKQVATCLGVAEQQVANIQFQSKRKMQEHLRVRGLNPDHFPELCDERE